MKKTEKHERWHVKDSEELYGIKNWGVGYFEISEKGEVIVVPDGTNAEAGVSLMDIISGLKERGHDMPVLLRFENILDSRITILNEAFRKAIKATGYRGKYRGVYPIKVNQQQQVVEEIVKHGRKYHHGLEVGSKAELVAVLSEFNDFEACLICNGYKDQEFIDLGLYARKIGFNLFFVIETPGEADTIMERANIMGVRPNIGLRLKVSSKAAGHWADTGGDRSIFGLNIAQMISVVDKLKEKGMADCIKLLHYHLGSQIPNIRDIRTAVFEASRVYAELVKEGCAMGYLDLGGGLAVDYDGTRTNYINSRNYSVDEYCADIVEVVMSVMNETETEHPVIITESGRAIVAYYSLLLFNVLDATSFEPEMSMNDEIPPDLHEQTDNLIHVLHNLNLKNLQECYNDAIFYRDEVRELFKHGKLTLRERSFAENIFWQIIFRIQQEKERLKKVPPDLKGIDLEVADIYYCNFSLFQSLPDSWAIDQIFPVMPVHRLKEKPARNAVLADITCDCEGKIDKFIDTHDINHILPVHPLKEGEEYYLGIFLVGAYQETIGDFHNLFGDTNVVSVKIYEDGDYDFTREIEGDTVSDVLSYLEYDPKLMIANFRNIAEKAIRNGRITVRERKEIMSAYENGMRGYTYFEKD